MLNIVKHKQMENVEYENIHMPKTENIPVILKWEDGLIKPSPPLTRNTFIWYDEFGNIIEKMSNDITWKFYG